MRKILAIWAAKLSATLGRLLGKKSTSTPGTIALKICPDLIKQLSKNVKQATIATCGTNGKTTTNNMLYAALKNCGYKVVCNSLGANMLSGVAAAFALQCDWLGRLDADFACLEVDEAYTVKVFEHVRPDFVIVTNIFRDQLDRYGEIDSVLDIIKTSFEKADFPTLILNGDDPVSSTFGQAYEGKVHYFGIGEEVISNHNDTKDGMFCAVCGAKQQYHYYHYSHLGDYYCTACGNKRPNIDFEAKNVNVTNGISFTVNEERVSLNHRGFYNIYNVLGVFGMMKLLGIKNERFADALSSYKPQIGRMQEIDLGKPFVLNLAKNPAGFNQAIQTVVQDKRKKDIIIAVNDKPSDGTDVSWLWDVDFEKVADGTLNILSVSGMRKYDLALRFKYADIKVDSINDNMKDALLKCLESDAEVCYVLVNYTMLFSTEDLMNEIQKEKGKN